MVRYFTTQYRIPLETEQKLKQALNEAGEFVSKLDHKYEYDRGGWHVTVTISEEEQRENLLMTLLLIDKNKYE